MEPSQFTFFWEYSSDLADADALLSLLGGFILHCYNNVSNSTTELHSHVHFVTRDDRLLEQFSLSLTQHVTCASQISSYMCDIRAFNEVGEGPRSTPTFINLGCSSESKTVNKWTTSGTPSIPDILGTVQKVSRLIRGVLISRIVLDTAGTMHGVLNSD